MTTEKKSENTPAATDNKAIFGPLGNYAIAGVIMVSIIVTTAIMLDKQLGRVDEQLAVIESEVAEMPAAATTSETTAATETEVATKTEVEVTEATGEVAKIETASVEAANETVETAAASVETPTADVAVTQETTPPVAAATKQETAQTSSAAPFDLATTQTSAQTHQAEFAKENQARIDAYKAKHKKQLSGMFARIKTLESQQLDRFKASQEGQITRLREQIAQQQKMIEALVLRNKDSFELRAANVQRNQENREQSLNRI